MICDFCKKNRKQIVYIYNNHAKFGFRIYKTNSFTEIQIIIDVPFVIFQGPTNLQGQYSKTGLKFDGNFFI